VTQRLPAIVVVLSFVCACGLLKGPDRVAREYLEAGAAGRDDEVADLVEPGCGDEDVLEVDAVRFFGVPIDIEELEVETEQMEGDRATVRYKAVGAASGENATGEILGVKVKAASVSASRVTRQGSIELVKLRGGWKVACD